MRIFIFILALFFISCASKQEFVNDENLDSKYAKLELKQDVKSLVSFDEKLSQNSKSYKDKFFYPWHVKLKKSSYKTSAIFWSFASYLNENKKYYFFNKEVISKDYFKKLIDNANTNAFLSLKKKAIISKTTYLKNIPSDTAILLNPFKEGEGLPFDYSLDNVLNIGTPVLISHFTKDKEFAFVMAESGFGFVKASDVEIFTEQRAKAYESLNFVTPIKERFKIMTVQGDFAFESRIGALYPYYEFKNGYYIGKMAELKYKIPSSAVAKFPLNLNDKNLKNQITELFAKPYGWGGYDYERDCSLMLRDIFASFSFYLPRNSYAQSITWKRFDISKLSNLQKQEFIKTYAKPYTTLLYLRGHIMLYVGELEGENVALHSIWGVRTKDDKRLLIGKSALTKLDVGSYSSEVDEKDLILSRLSAISFLSLSENELLRINEALEKYH